MQESKVDSQNGCCALCGCDKPLRISHVVPKFVAKWLKETSATGFLRGVINPTERIQDLPKLPLLCNDCEQQFSRYELYFAKNFFYPILEKGTIDVEYDERLLRFIVSLNWRTLRTDRTQVIEYPWIRPYVERAELAWREYLLGLSEDSAPYEHHMAYTGYLPEGTAVPKRFQWYTFRATDATLASNDKDSAFSFTHFPHFSFVSSIFPVSFNTWNKTRIEKIGKFSVNSQINDYYFHDFILSRVKIVLAALERLPSSQINDKVTSNYKRFLGSRSFEVYLEESRQQRQKRICSQTKGIQALIDIIERSLNNPQYNTIQQKWADFTLNFVANSLVSIPLEKSKVIDALLSSTVQLGNYQKPFSQCHFETEDIKVTFLVTICKSKKEQQDILSEVIEKLIEVRPIVDERVIVVFSFNPIDKELPFETAYYTPKTKRHEHRANPC